MSLLSCICRTRYDLGLEESNHIWRPILTFDDLLDYKPTRDFGNYGSFSFSYLGNQTLEYSEEILVKIFCTFDFDDYPFDSHECMLQYGDDSLSTESIILNPSKIAFGNVMTTENQSHIYLHNSPFAFIFELESLPSFMKNYDKSYSYTGMKITLRRKSLGQLISGFYLPTGVFAFLSQISFLIKAEAVSMF